MFSFTKKACHLSALLSTNAVRHFYPSYALFSNTPFAIIALQNVLAYIYKFICICTH